MHSNITINLLFLNAHTWRVTCKFPIDLPQRHLTEIRVGHSQSESDQTATEQGRCSHKPARTYYWHRQSSSTLAKVAIHHVNAKTQYMRVSIGRVRDMEASFILEFVSWGPHGAHRKTPQPSIGFMSKATVRTLTDWWKHPENGCKVKEHWMWPECIKTRFGSINGSLTKKKIPKMLF